MVDGPKLWPLLVTTSSPFTNTPVLQADTPLIKPDNGKPQNGVRCFLGMEGIVREICDNTLDEILHQLIGSLSHYLQGFLCFFTSPLVQDFFHEQYVPVCTGIASINNQTEI